MKTVTVRIPVAVYPDGEWGTATARQIDAEDQKLKNLYYEWENTERSIVWITAEVPVPEPTEVQGRVE